VQISATARALQESHTLLLIHRDMRHVLCRYFYVQVCDCLKWKLLFPTSGWTDWIPAFVERWGSLSCSWKSMFSWM